MVELVLILKLIALPLFTLICVEKPRIDVSPAPLTSQSVDGLPARQFSATIGFAGEVQADAAAAVVNVQVTLPASAFPATSLMRGSVAPPTRSTLNVDDAGRVIDGVKVAVRLVLL